MDDHKRKSHALIDALGVDLEMTGQRASAAILALSDEVIHLRTELSELRQQLLETETIADIDTLLPILNRRAFERELAREVANAERYGTPLCLIFVDLDRFKAVNDHFGHQTGDNVLIRIAEILNAVTRETDLVGRLGGDEFGIALTHATLEASVAKAAQLAERIDSLTVRDMSDDGQQPVRLGASCGVSEWSTGITPELLIAEADEAMFAIKATRRRQD